MSFIPSHCYLFSYLFSKLLKLILIHIYKSYFQNILNVSWFFIIILYLILKYSVIIYQHISKCPNLSKMLHTTFYIKYHNSFDHSLWITLYIIIKMVLTYWGKFKNKTNSQFYNIYIFPNIFFELHVEKDFYW